MVPVMLIFYVTDCKIVKERSRFRARPSSTVQAIFGQKKVLAGPFLFDKICFLVGSVSSSLYHDQSLTDVFMSLFHLTQGAKGGYYKNKIKKLTPK